MQGGGVWEHIQVKEMEGLQDGGFGEHIQVKGFGEHIQVKEGEWVQGWGSLGAYPSQGRKGGARRENLGLYIYTKKGDRGCKAGELGRIST